MSTTNSSSKKEVVVFEVGSTSYASKKMPSVRYNIPRDY